MSIKHDIEEQPATCPYRLLIPVAKYTTLKRGMFQEVREASRHPKLYTEMADAWEERINGQPQKDYIFAQQGFLWGASPKRVVVIPVKPKSLEMPTVPIDVIASKLVVACRKYGCAELAVAKHLWRNQRYTMEQVQELIDTLEKGGVTVHEYE